MKRTYYPYYINIWKEIVIIWDDNYELGFKKPYYKQLVKKWIIVIREWLTIIN